MAETASADLANLFNSPPRAAPPRSPTPPSPPTPARNYRGRGSSNPLFLSPGHSELGTPSRPARGRNYGDRARSITASPSPQRPRGAAPTSKAGPPAVAASAQRRREDSVPIPTALLGFEDPFAGLNGDVTSGLNGEDEDDGKKRKKRVFAKIDGQRLTGDKGFPALCRAAKKFKVKGKGHEAADLRNLLSMYQMWAHGMFPKGDFASTINRVEVVCRSRRMESAIKGYREAFYPRPASPTPPRDFSPMSDADAAAENENEMVEAAGLAGSEPLFAPAPEAHDEPNDADIEEMMVLEEMEREEAEQQRRSQVQRPATGDLGPPVLEEENEWEGLYD